MLYDIHIFMWKVKNFFVSSHVNAFVKSACHIEMKNEN
jgi:hypothetical protein